MDKVEYTKMYKLEDSYFWFVGKRYLVDAVLEKYKGTIKKILDLGSGTGGMTKHMQKYGDVVGVERYPYAIELASRRGIKVYKGSIDKLNFKSSDFDLVTIFDVLYHKNVPNESRVIREAYRVLKKGGLLLITDSALKMLTSKHDVVTQGKTRYSLNEMKNLIENGGFKTIRASYIFFSTFPLVFFKRVILDKLSKDPSSDDVEFSDPINKFLLNLIKIEARLLTKTNYPIGSSIVILAKK